VVEEAVVSAREEMLAEIRAAVGTGATNAISDAGYRQAGDLGEPGAPELVDLFCERVADYRAKVHCVNGANDLADALAAACADRGSSRVLRAPAVDWTIEGVQLSPDSPDLSATHFDAADAALTGCALAIAETGTFVLDGSPICGRRALTLVPDHHICVVRADQVVANIPDAIAALGDAARAGRPLTFVSGPSATSDIELQRVEGVHGPRKLDVVVFS
jgi:L-lactate dehydrogenase complex protein LldG